MGQKENNQLYELVHEPVGKLLWRYSLPAIVGFVVMSAYNVVDRIFIGQGVGPEAIAGLAITFPVMNIVTALGVLVGGGAGARTSIVLGQNNQRQADLILGNSLVLTLVFGFSYIAAFTIFLEEILRAFGASDVSLPYAYEFMIYIMPGLLLTNLTFSFNNIMRASGYPTKAMITMFIGAGCNVVLAPIFIFGFKLGIKGAAIATDISMAISAFFVMWHFVNKRSLLHFKPGTFTLNKQIIFSIVSIGSAPAIINVTGCAVNAIVNNQLMNFGGDNAVAAMGIFTVVCQIVIQIVIGVNQGMQPIVGFNYGARRYDRLTRAYWLTVAASSVVTGLGFAAAKLCPELIARAFTTDEELIHLTGRTLSVCMSMMIIVGYQITSTNFFQSLGMASRSIFMSLTRQVLFLIPSLFILPEIFGLAGVWMSFPVADGISTFVTMLLTIQILRKISRLQSTQTS